MPKTETTLINGIDVDRLQGLAGALKNKPELGIFRFHAHNRWIDGTHCKTEIKDFYAAADKDTTRKKAFEMEADEPDILLGEDHGPNATEYVLHALASCLNATFIYHASARGVQIDELELDLRGELDLSGIMGLSPDVRNGFENIHVTFRVRSDAPPEVIEELCELAQRRSPVFDIVTHPVPVQVTLERF